MLAIYFKDFRTFYSFFYFVTFNWEFFPVDWDKGTIFNWEYDLNVIKYAPKYPCTHRLK